MKVLLDAEMQTLQGQSGSPREARQELLLDRDKGEGLVDTPRTEREPTRGTPTYCSNVHSGDQADEDQLGRGGVTEDV